MGVRFASAWGTRLGQFEIGIGMCGTGRLVSSEEANVCFIIEAQSSIIEKNGPTAEQWNVDK